MPSQTAAHKGNCYIDECEVQWVTPNVVDQHGVSCDTQRFGREPSYLFRLEMVSEERTPDAINARIGKGKLKSISRHRSEATPKM